MKVDQESGTNRAEVPIETCPNLSWPRNLDVRGTERKSDTPKLI